MLNEFGSGRSIVLRYSIPALAAVGLLWDVLYGPIRDARERARSAPHVSVFGQGSAQHFTTWIHASGKPSSELEPLVGKAVGNFVDHTLRKEADFVRWAKTNGRAHSRALGLCITVPQLSGRAIERLREFPRTDGIFLGILIETSHITADGLQVLESLVNVDDITIRGAQLSATDIADLKDALPNCTVNTEEIPKT
jgi:hypothetical protein